MAGGLVGGREGGETCGGTQERSLSCSFIGGSVVGFLGVEEVDRVSLVVVWPSPDDLIELVTWRECPLHIPVSFDLITGTQLSLSHTTSQQTLGRPEGPGWR